MKIYILSLVCLCVASSGFLAARRLIIKEKTLMYMSELLKYISWRVASFRTPLNEIFLSFECPFFDSCSFSEELGSHGFVKALDKLRIDNAIKEKLTAFGEGLGLKNAEYQVISCNETAMAIDSEYKKMKVEYKDKRKLYIALSLAFAALIFIICI